MQTSAAFWDKLARKYAARPVSNEDAYKQTLDRVRQYLSKEDHVLELGCGTGTTALLLADHVKSYRASDISSEMIAIANEKREASCQTNLQCVTAGLNAPELDEQAPYDAVLAFNVIHLFDDTDQALSRIHHLVKPGGLLISKTVCLSGKYGFLRLPVFFMQLLGKAPLVRFMSGKALVNKMENAGFEIVEEGTFANIKIQHFVVARKVG